MRPELSQAIGLLRGNSREQIEQAIELLQNTVFSFSMKVCGHREDAEDTMQEVLYRSLGHMVEIDDPSALAVWLYTVARNRCWRMRSKDKARAKRIPLDEWMPSEAELSHLIADQAPGPDQRVLKAEQHQLLHEAVQRLPADLRIVLVLHDMEELDTDEVARILALKPGTVRVRLHRARLMLRKDLGNPSRATRPAQRTVKKNAREATKPGGRKRPAECRELFRNLSEYLDGRLEAPSCDRMSEHIESCPACIAFLRDLRSAIDRCRQMEVRCSATTTRRLRSLLTREYLRLLEAADAKKPLS